MSPTAPRKAAVVAVLLAVTLVGAGAGGEEPTPVPTGDVEQLRAYAESLVHQIEELRTEIARLARERDELAQQLVEARSALETLKDGERRRLAKKAEVERSGPKEGGGLAGAPLAPVRGDDRSGVEIVATADAKTAGEPHPASVAPLGANDPTSGGVVDRRTESQRQIERLEAELRQLRDREQASQANAKNLEQALDVEKQAGQSKLEALQSVLLSTRSATAQLRDELEETRRQNNELSQQASVLHARRDASPHTSDQGQAVRTQELAGGNAPETKPTLVPSAQPRKPKPVSLSAQAKKPDTVRSSQTADSELAGTVASAKTIENPAEATDLREQLSVERERRETLEEEVKRLTSTGSSDEKFTEVWNALQSAHSEILVLSNQLAEERKSREDLEEALARTQLEPGTQSNTDLAKRLAQTLTDRRSEAARLAAQLKEANEMIVRLKGRLEASGSPEAESKMLTELQKDNETLRTALKAAEEANDALREKAEMAQRLAEMVYGKGP
jgi:DNA repair exonuclease SbcCD ATPase subunit